MFILTMAYPAFTGVRMLLSGNGDQRTILTMLSLWAVVITELMFYKSTPNVYLFVIGITTCLATFRE
ncbi:hypothetical protein AV929_11825 [Haloarcula sp. K1]|nr:hypothetical protein AV929_11825 [Haloarcula sp. K1]